MKACWKLLESTDGSFATGYLTTIFLFSASTYMFCSMMQKLGLLLPGEVLGRDAAVTAVGAAVAPSGTFNSHLFGFLELWLIPLGDVLDEVDRLVGQHADLETLGSGAKSGVEKSEDAHFGISLTGQQVQWA